MRITYKELADRKEAFDRLGRIKLPITASLSIAKAASKVDDALVPFYKVRDGLFAGYKVGRQQEGNLLILKTEKEEDNPKFIEEWNSLLKEEVEFTALKFKLPGKVAATCDKCKHNMDKELEIESSILSTLIDFIE